MTDTTLGAADTGAEQKTAGDTTTEASPKAGAEVAQKQEAGVDDAKAKATTEGGEKAGEAKAAEAKAEGKAQAEPAFKLPEGWKADEALLKDFGAIAKEAGLKGEHAQKLVDAYVKAQESEARRAEEAFSGQRKEWLDKARADREFGGEKFDSNAVIARQAVVRFGDKELADVLNEYGLGDHPALIRAFWKVGKALAEDSVAGTTAAAGNGVSSEDALLRQRYPTMFKEKEQ
jgi:hypothetical protein